ncbi:MAG: hypothetical protein ABI836_06535 [Gemmatimonadota bacterium]
MRRRTLPGTLTLTTVMVFGLAGSALAQIDYRNLDDDRPVTTEDAYPVERYAFEFLLPYRFEAAPGDFQVHSTVPEITYGLIRNAQVGVKLPFAVANEGVETTTGLAGLRVFGLYNFNSESRWLPAFALRGDAGFPVGSLAGEGSRFAVKLIATRSWGRMRIHVNGARGFGPEDVLPAVEAINRWSGSVAVDRTFFRSSLLLIGEIAVSEPVRNARTVLNASLGGRWQWTPTMVLDVGVTRRLRSTSGPDFGVTIGLSHAFAIRGLMPSGPR